MAAKPVEVALVGCGAPRRGMGWYHCKQLLDGRVDGGKLVDIVEPWFLGKGKETPLAEEFMSWVAKYSGLGVHASIGESPPINGKKLAIICCRTADNPRMVSEAIEHGFTHIYLEKPGANTVAELEQMLELTKSKGVVVFMGYNRNFSKYILQANAHLATAAPGSTLTLGRNDCFTAEMLDECFERNAEGMIKNQMVHEIVTMITYHGLTADSIAEVVADPAHTVLETRKGIEDFSKMRCTIKTKSGRAFVLWGDRLNGEYAEAKVKTAGQEEEFKAVRPDSKLTEKKRKLDEETPGCMPYFTLQDDEYLNLKQAVVAAMTADDGKLPEGLAGLDTAIESMKVCDLITESLKASLRKGLD
eukprot:CAMPEP_0172688484 /NCGR_PEP_ID=MMETSP1074-20121228/22449_1 /TAXON_ID=2916 /ORGANISM="Ceratium fusus, Strain PA161109" /LENGTH=359 /DNA_ID=CAMNT_0013508129 /DNA_START=61 /DNA_END=1140 /DNA_ORIENTATION=-